MHIPTVWRGYAHSNKPFLVKFDNNSFLPARIIRLYRNIGAAESAAQSVRQRNHSIDKAEYHCQHPKSFDKILHGVPPVIIINSVTADSYFLQSRQAVTGRFCPELILIHGINIKIFLKRDALLSHFFGSLHTHIADVP